MSEQSREHELRGWPYARSRFKAWAEFGVTSMSVVGVMVALIRIYPGPPAFPFGMVEGEAHWALFGALLALGGAWRLRAKRRGIALVLALIVLLPWCFEWLPTWLSAPPRPAHPVARLRIMSTNLLAPSPSHVLAQEIRESDADVVLVQEVSDTWWTLLEREGVLRRYPHHVEEVHATSDDYMGIAILSRLPIESTQIERLVSRNVPVARIDVRLSGTDGQPLLLRLYSVHTTPPNRADRLRINRAQFEQAARMARADIESGAFHAVILGGDFNGSPTSYAYRRLRDAGFIAGHERVGRGFAMTWPEAVYLMPPMRLDHLFFLEREANTVHVLSVREGDPGLSDHRPLLVDLAFSAARPR